MELSSPLAYAEDPRTAADKAAALESAGLDAVWVAEAYGFDSPTIMGYLAARTERMRIGSAVLNVYSRTPRSSRRPPRDSTRSAAGAPSSASAPRDRRSSRAGTAASTTARWAAPAR